MSVPTPGTEIEVGVIGALRGLAVVGEVSTEDFDRADFEYHRRYLCDQPGTDPYTGAEFSEDCDVDHIVAAQEMFESGGHLWEVSRRREAGNDADNLIASRSCVNRSKGGGDLAEWPAALAQACQSQLRAVVFWLGRPWSSNSAGTWPWTQLSSRPWRECLAGAPPRGRCRRRRADSSRQPPPPKPQRRQHRRPSPAVTATRPISPACRIWPATR